MIKKERNMFGFTNSALNKVSRKNVSLSMSSKDQLKFPFILRTIKIHSHISTTFSIDRSILETSKYTKGTPTSS